MDKQNNMQPMSTEPVPPPPPPPMETAQPTDGTQPAQPQGDIVYATFGQRLGAFIIDCLIVFAIAFGVGVLLGIASAAAGIEEIDRGLSNLLGNLVTWIYFVGFTMTQGATIGKKVLGLRVQHVNTGQNLNFVQALLREVLGRFLSAIPIGLGYFWMLWDGKKQTWHDKLGTSVVVKVK